MSVFSNLFYSRSLCFREAARGTNVPWHLNLQKKGFDSKKRFLGTSLYVQSAARQGAVVFALRQSEVTREGPFDELF